jgi:enoyl-CoA hydratase/carnithine racemase
MTQATPSLVTTEVDGHVFLIGLNRPEKRNAANLQMLSELALAYGELDRRDDLRVGVVFAHGDHFSAGLDLADVGPAMARTGSLPIPEGGLDPWGISTAQVKKPVVMAISGICYTLGIELALASDVVVADRSASFAQLEVARGIMPFGGATTRFPRAAGWSGAMRWILTAESFGPEDALAARVVTEVVDNNPLEAARAIAATIAAQAPLAVQATLASARAGIADAAAEHRELPRRLGALMATQDVQRGLEAFMTKQPADFQGD